MPPGVRLATKIVPARRTVERAVAAGVPADAGYGPDPALCKAVEGAGSGGVVGVRTDHAAFVGGR